MKEPIDLVDKVIYDIVLNNSPIQNKNILDNTEKKGIGRRRVLRHLNILVNEKFIKKKKTGLNTIYYIDKGIKIRPTLDFIIDSLILLERKIPESSKIISKTITPTEFQKINDIFVDIGKLKRALELMLLWEIPSDENIYTSDKERNEIVSKHGNRLLPIKISTIKDIIKKIEKNEVLLIEKLRNTNHDLYSYIHNYQFNKLD